MRALKERLGEGAVQAYGIGGPRLQGEGLRAVADARSLLAMGFTEILGRLPKIFGALRAITDAARRERPDIAIVIDYPDFHFRLAKRLRAIGVPVVYYIPPKVWVWRQHRVKTLRERFVGLLCILPFEEEFYRRHGMSVKYVGNPLIDELPLDLTREQARAQLGLKQDEPVLLVMPGSRPSELKYHLDWVMDSAVQTARKLRASGRLGGSDRLRVLVPYPVTADLEEQKRRLEEWGARNPELRSLLEFRTSRGDSAICMVAADAGIIKSGTSTLEAAILGCPHVIVYRANPISHWIFDHIVRRQFAGPVGLANLVYGWKAGEPWLIREFLDRHTGAELVADEVHSLWIEGPRRSQVLEGLARVRSRILSTEGESQALAGPSGPPGVPQARRRSPSEVAAEEVLRLVSQLDGARS